MPSINRITNSNKLIEEKVNYFLDRINHAASYAGRHWHLELESPTSLLGKIIFRFQKDQQYRLEYFDHYFKNSFFTEDTYWDNYPKYKEVRKVVTQYNEVGNSRNKIADKEKLLDSSVFQNNLLLLHRDLLHKMPEDLVNGVLSVIQCGHKLDELVPGSTQTHAEALNSLALTLVSEYIFRGYTRSEIIDIISWVFSKDLDSFPFPSHVRTKTQRKKHLAEGSLYNQLHGFSNAFKRDPQKGIIMVKVYGGAFPDDFYFKYNEVSFLGKRHPKIKEITGKMKADDVSDFFPTGDYLLAAASLNWHSSKSLLAKINAIVRKELNFLSAVLNRDFSVDTTNNYIWLTARKKYVGLAWSTQRYNSYFPEHELDRLKENGYQALRKAKTSAADWFLKFEPLFVMAHKNTSLSDYWLYLETLLSYNRPKKKVKDIVSSVLLNNEKLIRDRRILTTLSNCFTFFNEGYNMLNVSSERWSKIYSAFAKGKIFKEVRNVKYPFIQELIMEFDAILTTDYYKKAKSYYHDILTETYEYRNFQFHKGLENDVSREKLKVTLPNMVIRMRWAIFESLKSDVQDVPFDLLIDNLVKKGEVYLKPAIS